jgi:hypothetical protein
MDYVPPVPDQKSVLFFVLFYNLQDFFVIGRVPELLPNRRFAEEAR